jgi:glycosyltransferase involved in cell wall biosynthesis
VGALDKRKNLVVLVKALTLLVEQGTNARLVLVSGATAQTDPSFRAEMLSVSDSVRERIQILRQVSDNRLAEIYEESPVVAVPSLAEGFGLPVTESLRKGRPVVAASTTALTELAGVLPVRLAEPHDAEEWATQLREASEAKDFAALVVAPAGFPQDWVEFRSRVLG